MDHVTIETPITVAEITLIPIVRNNLFSNKDEMGYWLTGSKEPLAIILCNKDGVRAFDMNSIEIAIAPLIQKVSDLNEVLKPYW